MDSDAFVFFGASGDLAQKKIFPALQALAGDGRLDIPVIGIARSNWSDAHFREHAKAAIQKHGKLDAKAFQHLAQRLHYVRGDYADAQTFKRLVTALNGAARPLHYYQLWHERVHRDLGARWLRGIVADVARELVPQP